MKKVESFCLILIATALIAAFLSTSTWTVLSASIVLLVGGFSFFLLNLFYGFPWLEEKKWGLFLTRSLIPFVLVYFLCVYLYTQYWVELSEGATFEWSYTLRSFPHQEAMLLPLLYAFGLVYGYLRKNHRARKITLWAIFGTGLVAAALYFIPYGIGGIQTEETHLIEGEFTSVSDLVKLPQFADKTVYIDLWFSSCTPCIEQFERHLPGLKAATKDTEVVYLYVARETSHPDSWLRWRKAIDDYQLKGWHYYFPKSAEPQMWEEILERASLKYGGYPHYLIAKNGEITDFRAPKPSDREAVLEAIAAK